MTPYGLITVSVTAWEWLVAPLVPVIERVRVPCEPPLSALIAITEVAVPPGESVTLGGLKVPTTLLGTPLTDKLTLPLKLLSDVSATVYWVLPGRSTVLLGGVTLMLKSEAPIGLGKDVGVWVIVGVVVTASLG